MATPRPSLQPRIPGAAAGLGRGQGLRALVEKALKRRRYLVAHGKCRVPDESMRMSVMRLEVWLDRNPHAGELALARFDAALVADVDLVRPHNAEGDKLMNELRGLLAVRT